MEVSEREYRILVKEVAERLRDVTCFLADPLADRVLREFGYHEGIPDSEDGTNKITFNMYAEMRVDDFRQIIARAKRTKARNKAKLIGIKVTKPYSAGTNITRP